MRAKKCMSECGPTGKKTPREVAESYGYTDIVEILKPPVINWKTDWKTSAPFDTVIDRRGLGLVAITLAAFKKTFHPEPVDEDRPIDMLLEDIFKTMNASATQWQTVRDQVCDTLYIANKASSDIIKRMSKDREAFYKSIINAYTRENTGLYDIVNTVLRQQTETDYTPSAMDIAAGPYIVMLKIILLYWKNVPREHLKTYRSMLLTHDQSNHYQVGEKFTWLSFASSSVDLAMALSFPTRCGRGEYSVIFTIDNTMQSARQPRNIEEFAAYQERERVYPAGARFIVTERDEKANGTHVGLRLID